MLRTVKAAPDSLGELETWYRAQKPVEIEGLPPFWGGAVGLLSYDAVRAVRAIRLANPYLPVYARAHDRAEMDRLIAAGASIVVPETLEASLQLGGQVLAGAGRALVHDRLPHRVPTRLKSFDDFRIASNHDRQSSVLCTNITA